MTTRSPIPTTEETSPTAVTPAPPTFQEPEEKSVAGIPKPSERSKLDDRAWHAFDLHPPPELAEEALSDPAGGDRRQTGA